MNKVMLSIVLSVAFLFAACSAPENVPPAPSAPDGSDNLAGQATAGPLEINPDLFSSPRFSLSDYSLMLTDSDDSIRIFASDRYIWSDAYIYRPTGYEKVKLFPDTDGRTVNGWIPEYAVGGFDVSTSDYSNVPILVYSCDRTSSGWDCADNKWQLEQVYLYVEDTPIESFACEEKMGLYDGHSMTLSTFEEAVLYGSIPVEDSQESMSYEIPFALIDSTSYSADSGWSRFILGSEEITDSLDMYESKTYFVDGFTVDVTLAAASDVNAGFCISVSHDMPEAPVDPTGALEPKSKVLVTLERYDDSESLRGSGVMLLSEGLTESIWLGDNYSAEVTALVIAEDHAKLLVNGEVTDSLSIGDTDVTSDNVVVRLDNLEYSS